MKNQWNLSDLIFQGCQLEAAEQGAVKIVTNNREPNQGELHQVAGIKKSRCYLRKNKTSSKIEGRYVKQFSNKKFETCSSCTCPGKKIPST